MFFPDEWEEIRMLSQSSATDQAKKSEVATKAVLSAASKLEISGKALSKVLGLSEGTVSKMRAGNFRLQEGSKEFELGVLFVRLYRSLDAIVGGDESVARNWLENRNTALHKKPIEMIESIQGLTDVIRYLDSRRAPV